MTNLNELHLDARRTRRNVVKMGAVLTSAAVASLATVKDGAAEDDNGEVRIRVSIRAKAATSTA